MIVETANDVPTVVAAEQNAENKPDTPSRGYTRQFERWQLPHSLLGGTLSMRNGGKTWLPQHRNEGEERYKIRLAQTFLYPAFKKTVKRLTSKPFSKQVTITELTEERLGAIEENADRSGNDLTQLAKLAFDDAAAYGKTHFFVDFPKMSGEETRAEERQSGARPVIRHVPALALIGWRSKVNDNGETILTQVRFTEESEEEHGTFGDRTAYYVRVINAGDSELETQGTWELWRSYDRQRWEMTESGTHSFTALPLVTVYFNRTRYMEAEPPLEGIADLNLAHYRSTSDQRNILHVIRLALLFGKGFPQDLIDEGLNISPNSAVLLKGTEADLKYVEHSGEAVAAGERDLKWLHDLMEVLGLAPLIERVSDSTATGVKVNEGESMTIIQSWIRALEIGLEQAYGFAADIIKSTLPEDFAIDIFSEFAIGADGDLEFLLKSCLAGKISTERFLLEVKRRGVLSDDTNIEDEMTNARDEMASTLADDDDDFGDNDDDEDDPFNNSGKDNDNDDDDDE